MADDIIALSRFRAELARSHRRRAEVLLGSPEARALVPRLPVQELYYAIKETGLADAHQLLELASIEQVQGMLDIDCWQRSSLDTTNMLAWLGALAEVSPQKFGRALERLEPELIHLYFLKRVRVYDLTQEEQPPDEAEQLWPTPDGFFIVELLGDAETAGADQRLLDLLYRYDLELAQKILQGAKYDLESDLEETCYRFRSARMAELGYVSFDDAQRIYAFDRKPETTPAPPAKQGGEPLPAVLVREVDAQSFLTRTFSATSDDALLGRLEAELMVLLNHALAAEPVDPSDLKRGRDIFLRTLGYLDLGLQQVGHGSPEAALAEVGRRGLIACFQTGYSLVARLQLAARTLAERGRIRLASGKLLLDEPWASVVVATLHRRPLFPRLLDEPAGAGDRPFRALPEVGRLAQLLEEAALWPRLFFEGFGLTTEAVATLAIDQPEVTFLAMLRALVFSVLLDAPLAPTPRHPSELKAIRNFLDGDELSDAARARVRAALENALAESGLPPLPLDHWLRLAGHHLAARLTDGKGVLIKILK